MMKRKRKTELQEARMELEKVIKSKRPREKIRFEDFLAQYGDYPINPHLHTTKQLNKMTKKGLIRLVVKLEKFIVKVAYQMYKSKLPRLRTSFSKKHRPKSTRLVKIPISTPLGETYTLAPRGTSELAAQRFYDAGIRGGLETRKPIRFYEPKRKTKRKFSPKQLAAQRLFAKRARAGTLRKRKR